MEVSRDELKEVIQEVMAENPHTCRFSSQDMSDLKEFVKTYRESKCAIRKGIFKVIGWGVLMGLFALMGDKAKDIWNAVFN